MSVRKRSAVRARLTSKGQITLPIALRRRFDLQAGDEVEFVMNDKGAQVVPVKRRSIDELAGIFHRPGVPKPSAAEVAAAIGRYHGGRPERARRG